MKHSARRWIVGAVVALVLTLANSAALLFLGRPKQVRVLPDGTQVRLERVAVERTSQRFEGPEWQRSLWDLSGRRLLIAGQATTVSRVQDVLTLELAGTGVRKPERFNTAVLLDTHDCVFSGWQEYFPPSPGRSSAGRAELSFYSFPREGGTVRAGYVTDGMPILFDLPLDSGGTPPTLVSEPYPIRKQDGDLEYRLTRLAPARLPERLRPRAYFEVRKQGRRITEWVASGIRNSDGTGNRAQLVELATEPDGGVEFPGMCTRVPAWKLETWFAPADPARVPPDVEWTATGIELAGAGKVVLSGQTTDQSGVAIELVGTAGQGDAAWKPGSYSVHSTPVVRVRATLPRNDQGATLTLVKVTDASGRQLLPRPRLDRSEPTPPIAATWREYEGNIVQHDFPLRLASAAGKLNFTFRVHRMRKLDFLAKPPGSG